MAQPQIKVPKFLIFLVPVALFLAIFGSRFFKVIPVGHVGVASLFGSVQDEPFNEGFHIVNPFYAWVEYDARMSTMKENAEVPSQDQLKTSIDVSVQYRIDSKMTPIILQNTGTTQQLITVHLTPNLRSELREIGKSVARAEDFFLKETQERIQAELTNSLAEALAPKGIIVANVLLRDISLPPFIVKAIESKKEREQAVEKQKAELSRFRTEQEQKVASAEAERNAAEQEAEQIKLLADAKAYEINAINEAIKDNPAYIKLEALRALTEISKDPASKLYFMDGSSPMPLPLMNIGDK